DPQSSENTNVATPSENEGSAALNKRRRSLSPRRQAGAALSSAIATIAGAGLNSIADAMKNVSEAETSALTPGIFTAHAPATTPSAANTSVFIGGGVTNIV